MRLHKELVAASSVPLVLSILSQGDSYGYAIIQRIKEVSTGEIEWTDGMLYPVLRWLEKGGMAQSRWAKSKSGRSRRYYSLQSDGPEGASTAQNRMDTNYLYFEPTLGIVAWSSAEAIHRAGGKGTDPPDQPCNSSVTPCEGRLTVADVSSSC